MSTANRLSILLLLAILALPAAASGERVGAVVLTRNDVQGTPPGEATAPLDVGSEVLLDMRVETGADSAAKMTFDPRGAVTLGEEARVTFHRAELDEITGRRRSLISVLLGKLRLAFAPRLEGEVEVDTPTATLGVKGTDVRVSVAAAGRTVVEVLEGLVEVTSKARGGTVLVASGQLTVVEPGRAPTRPVPLDPTGGTLSPSAGGPEFTVPRESTFELPPILLENFPQGPRGDFPGNPPLFLSAPPCAAGGCGPGG